LDELQDTNLGETFKSSLEDEVRKLEPICLRAKVIVRALSIIMAESSNRKNIAGDKLDPSTSSCAFPFWEASNGILVVKLLKRASGEAEDEGGGSSVDLLFPQSLLI
jgi:hypothetical protein